MHLVLCILIIEINLAFVKHTDTLVICSCCCCSAGREMRNDKNNHTQQLFYSVKSSSGSKYTMINNTFITNNLIEFYFNLFRIPGISVKVISNRNVTSSVSRAREEEIRRVDLFHIGRFMCADTHAHIIGSVSSAIISIHDILRTVYKLVVVGAIRFSDANLCQRRKQT